MKAFFLLLLMCGVARAEVAFVPHPGALVPLDTPFHDERAQATTLREALGGRPGVLALGYFHCPNLCSTVRADLWRALDGVGDAAVVAISIDPAETMADAARARAMDQPPAQARYLVGEAAGLAAAVGFGYRRDDRLEQYLHPAGLVVLSASGVVSGYLLGVGYGAAELRTALARARDAVVAPAPSPILLLCFHYDPVTGRYSLAAMRATQLAAVLTVAGLGVWLLAAHRRRA